MAAKNWLAHFARCGRIRFKWRRIFRRRSTGTWPGRSASPWRDAGAHCGVHADLGGDSQEAEDDDAGGAGLFWDTRADGRGRNQAEVEGGAGGVAEGFWGRVCGMAGDADTGISGGDGHGAGREDGEIAVRAAA